MISNEAVCTIIAKNYVASARALAQSFLKQHPTHKVFVLIVDDFEGYINPENEAFETLRLPDLQIPEREGFCFQYDIKELCTAVKAFLLDYLTRQKGVERLVYLDPDILVTGSLDHLFAQLRIHDIVLTPHLDEDYPDDGLLPDDGYILRAGVFNLGFIGVNSSTNAAAFLDWWKSKLAKHCVVDLLNGYFVDQKFIDLVPLFFPNVHIEKNVGYNAAYWNAHSRRLSRNNGTWNCNDSSLYFFHFSGYSPVSAAVSAHIPNHVSRHKFSNRPDLKEIFSAYKELLVSHGHYEARKWPYSFACFDTGEPIPARLRAFYRDRTDRRRFGNPFTSPALKRMCGARHPKVSGNGHGSGGELLLTADQQLEAIMNSRAWRWVSRYGRIKEGYLRPALNNLRLLRFPVAVRLKTRTAQPVTSPADDPAPTHFIDHQCDEIPQRDDITIKIRPGHGWRLVDLQEIWEHRDLFYFLVWRDLKVRYRQTILGASWIILQPLLMTLIFVMFLGVIARGSTDTIPYPLFLYAALMAWTFFSSAVSGASFSLSANASLITKVYFPRVLIPIATIAVRLTDLLIASLVLIALFAYYRVAPHWAMLAAPLVLIQLTILATAIGLWFAALNVKYRDVGTVLPVLLQLWLFASPIIYPMSFVPAGLRQVYSLNPLVGLTENLRAAFFGLPFHYYSLISSMVVTLVLLVYSLHLFRKIEDEFADRV